MTMIQRIAVSAWPASLKMSSLLQDPPIKHLTSTTWVRWSCGLLLKHSRPYPSPKPVTVTCTCMGCLLMVTRVTLRLTLAAGLEMCDAPGFQPGFCKKIPCRPVLRTYRALRPCRWRRSLYINGKLQGLRFVEIQVMSSSLFASHSENELPSQDATHPHPRALNGGALSKTKFEYTKPKTLRVPLQLVTCIRTQSR